MRPPPQPGWWGPTVSGTSTRGEARAAGRLLATSACGFMAAATAGFTPADAPSASTPAAPRKKRSVDYLLEGESVKANRHLARFAAAPFLPLLLREPAFGSMLSRTSKALRKEIWAASPERR